MPNLADTNPSPTPRRPSRLRLRATGWIAASILLILLFACFASLPWTFGRASDAAGLVRYNAGDAAANRLPPAWISPDDERRDRLNALVSADALTALAPRSNRSPAEILRDPTPDERAALQHAWPTFLLGTDALGRSLLIRLLAGGAISLAVGLAAAALAVLVGTLYGSLAAYLGGRTDAILMRIVDVLYGLPYILLVVLIAVASDSLADEFVSRAKARERWVQREVASAAASPDAAALERLHARALIEVPPRRLSDTQRVTIDLATLLLAISGVSWLTMARVVRGQVLSLKERPFVEAARALGASPTRIFARHLLPNLAGTIIVYATLTVPQAILQESFLSFLGIGVKPPLPSWGNLAAEGLAELNPYRSHWWLLAFPCALLAITLLALNFLGESLRAALDPRSTPR